MEPIAVFEEHGEVLVHWSARAYRKEVLVCCDRHLDLNKIADRQLARLHVASAHPGTLGTLLQDIPFRDDDAFAYGLDNFVFAAAELGFLERFVWVVPERRRLSAAALGRLLWDRLSLLSDHGREIMDGFVVGPVSARTHILDTIVEVTTLRRLARLDGIGNARVDIDLDFFCDTNGNFDHDLSELVNALEAAGLREAVESLCFSITSGFFPEDARGLAGHLGKRLGRPLEAFSSPPVHANHSLALLSQKRQLDRARIDALWTGELAVLGGPGWTLRGVFEARAGDLDAATQSYASARAAGDRATWAAYTIGMQALERRDYRRATHWFEAAGRELLGTMQAHAMLMHSLCLCRLGRLEEALERAQSCIERIPMRVEGYRLGACLRPAWTQRPS